MACANCTDVAKEVDGKRLYLVADPAVQAQSMGVIKKS